MPFLPPNCMVHDCLFIYMAAGHHIRRSFPYPPPGDAAGSLQQGLTRKQTVIHLPTPTENVTTLTCELQNFFIWLKVCCILSNVGGSEESHLWLSLVAVKRTGCGNWNVRQAPSQQCFQSFSTLLSYSTQRCAEIQPMSQQSAATSCNMSVSIHVLLL